MRQPGTPAALIPAEAWLTSDEGGEWVTSELRDEVITTCIELTPAWGKQSSQQAQRAAQRCNTLAASRLLSTGRHRHGLQGLLRRHRRQVARLLKHPDLITYTEASYTGEAIWEELYHTLLHWLIARFCVSVCLFNAWAEDSATLWRALLERLMGGAPERLKPPPRQSRPAVQPRAPAASELAFV